MLDESERAGSFVNSPAHTFADSLLRCLCLPSILWDKSVVCLRLFLSFAVDIYVRSMNIGLVQ